MTNTQTHRSTAIRMGKTIKEGDSIIDNGKIYRLNYLLNEIPDRNKASGRRDYNCTIEGTKATRVFGVWNKTEYETIETKECNDD